MLRYPKYRRLAAQPMLVPFMVATSVSSIHSLKITRSNLKLLAIEEQLGQHTYHERPKGNPLDADFVDTSSELNSNSNVLGVNENRLHALVFALERMTEYNAGTVPLSLHPSVRAGIPDMEDAIAHLRNYASTLLFRNAAEQKRTQTHLAVVFNFMAQRDNLTNISLASDSRLIAAASRRDSSAMKTIAVVTMVFLPGTYVSALFAVPLFRWDAPPGQPVVVQDRFWYYWAVTVPLTVAVLLLWMAWEHLVQTLEGTRKRLFLKRLRGKKGGGGADAERQDGRAPLVEKAANFEGPGAGEGIRQR